MSTNKNSSGVSLPVAAVATLLLTGLGIGVQWGVILLVGALDCGDSWFWIALGAGIGTICLAAHSVIKICKKWFGEV